MMIRIHWLALLTIFLVLFIGNMVYALNDGADTVAIRGPLEDALWTSWVQMLALIAVIFAHLLTRKEPLIIRYVNLIHANDGNPEALACQRFVYKHSDDADFCRRARALNELFRIKDETTT